MKIDCHVHMLPAGGDSADGAGFMRARGYRALGAKIFRRRLGLPNSGDPEELRFAYADGVARAVLSSELDAAVLLALDAVHDVSGEVRLDRTMLYAPNDAVAAICARHPGTLLLGASVHPHRADALDELERVASLGAVLVKLLPNSQGFDPGDARHVPYYRKLADLGLPMLVHCGFEHTLPPVDQAFGFPSRLVPALEAGVRVVVAHAGSSGRFHLRETFGDFLRLLERYPNCFGDTSALANWWRSQYLFRLLDPEDLERRYGIRLEAPLDRFVHGSDYPVPVTPFAFAGRTRHADRRRVAAHESPLQRDIDLKRLAGVPDAILERGARLLGLPESPREHPYR